jgi:hypothetical protein
MIKSRPSRSAFRRALRFEGLEQRLPLDLDDSLGEAVSLGTITTSARTVNDRIDPDTDVDMYSFNAAAGQVIDFDIDTVTNGPGELGSYLRIFDSTGRQIAFNNDATAPGENDVGFDAYLRHAFTAAGTYYVGVSNLNNSSYDPVTGDEDTTGGLDAIGDYRLIVRGLPNDTDDTITEADSLGDITSVPETVNATIDPDIDVDLFSFRVTAGEVVDFDIDTAINGPGGLGSLLRIFNAQGQQLALNDDAAAPGEGGVGFDSYLRHTFATAGTYYVGVSNWNNRTYDPTTGNGDTAGGRYSIGDYQLIVTSVPDEPTDDDRLFVTIDRTSIREFGGTAIGTVTRSTPDQSGDLLITLTSSDTTEATVPDFVEIPANQSSVSFVITAVDDSFVDGTQTVLITAEAGGFADGSRSIHVTDSDGRWHNRLRPFDVNNDTSLSPIDALLIINFLNAFGSGPVPSGSPPPFFDVNSDDFISPIDALLVINALNSQQSVMAAGASETQAEGEEGPQAPPSSAASAEPSSSAPLALMMMSESDAQATRRRQQANHSASLDAYFAELGSAAS